MKKLFALMMVGAFAVAIVACGGKKTDESASADSLATQVEAMADSAMEVIDSTAEATIDSLKEVK